MICGKCSKEVKLGDGCEIEATSLGGFGNVLCKDCKLPPYSAPSVWLEPTTPVQGAWTRKTKLDREHHQADILQPHNKDGFANEQFIKQYGEEGYVKEFGKKPQFYKRKWR